MAFQVRTTETLMGKAPSRIDQSLGDGNGKSLEWLDDWQGFAPNTTRFFFFFLRGGKGIKKQVGCFFFLDFFFLCFFAKRLVFTWFWRGSQFFGNLYSLFFFLYLESIDDVFLSSHGVDQLFMVGILSEIRILCLHFQGTGWRAISKRFQMWLGRWKR